MRVFWSLVGTSFAAKGAKSLTEHPIANDPSKIGYYYRCPPGFSWTGLQPLPSSSSVSFGEPEPIEFGAPNSLLLGSGHPTCQTQEAAEPYPR